MTPEEALVQLAESTAEAVSGVLRGFVGESLEQAAVTIVQRGASPFAQLEVPAVATSVSYVDGVTGGNLFVSGVAGARQLAAAMMGQEPEAGGELTELELSAVGEAMNQMMSAASAATSHTLGQEVRITAPETRFFDTEEEASAAYPETPYATTVAFTIGGEPCRLILLVPNSFVVRMTRALQTLAQTAGDVVAAPVGAINGDNLRTVPLRVWAELGRTRLPLSRAVGLPPGSVVELDRRAEEPVDLFVSGRRFARGVLVLVEDGEWAVRVEELLLTPSQITTEGENP
jgi:flagellar motor switch protein FliN/FliY